MFGSAGAGALAWTDLEQVVETSVVESEKVKYILELPVELGEVVKASKRLTTKEVGLVQLRVDSRGEPKASGRTARAARKCIVCENLTDVGLSL